MPPPHRRLGARVGTVPPRYFSFPVEKRIRNSSWRQAEGGRLLDVCCETSIRRRLRFSWIPEGKHESLEGAKLGCVLLLVPQRANFEMEVGFRVISVAKDVRDSFISFFILRSHACALSARHCDVALRVALLVPRRVGFGCILRALTVKTKDC